MVRQYYEQGAHVLLVDTGNSYLGLSQLIHNRTQDVYKRQPRQVLVFSENHIPTPHDVQLRSVSIHLQAFAETRQSYALPLQSVSYTHLDVYKRQV